MTFLSIVLIISFGPFNHIDEIEQKLKRHKSNSVVLRAIFVIKKQITVMWHHIQKLAFEGASDILR